MLTKLPVIVSSPIVIPPAQPRKLKEPIPTLFPETKQTPNLAKEPVHSIELPLPSERLLHKITLRCDRASI